MDNKLYMTRIFACQILRKGKNMKKIFTLLFAFVLGATILFSLASCGECEHTYGEWVVDRAATDSEVGERHRECTKCGDKITEEIPKLAHTHTYADAWSYDNTYHFHASTCGHASEVSGKAAHTYGEWIVDREATENAVGAKHRMCTVCNKVENVEIPELSHTHTYAEAWSYDDSYHWHDSTCGHETVISDKAKHTYENEVCILCGAKSPTSAERLEYTISDNANSYIVTGIGSFKGSRLTIPEKYNDLPVMSIGDFAFSDCTELTNITIPCSIQTIGNWAFSGCSNVQTVLFEKNSQCLSIGDCAFMDCARIVTITIPHSMTNIGRRAFSGCYKLIEVVNHSPSITIESYNVGEYAKHIITDAKDKYLATDDNGYIFYDDGNNVYLMGCTGNSTELFLPEKSPNGKAYEIYPYAFYNHTWLTSVMIPDGVTDVGYQAFYSCTVLKYTVYGNSYYLGNRNNPYLVLMSAINKESSSVQIHDKTKILHHFAFENCIGLTTITIPSGVQTIGKSTFYGCSNLQAVTFAEHSQCSSIGDSAFSDCARLAIINIPNSITNIDDYTFSGCGFISITIPNSITSIGNAAFNWCQELTNITIPSSIQNIGDRSLMNCFNLQTVAFVENSKCTSIGEWAFYYCKKLTSITIPNSVTSIGDSAFNGCRELTSITIGNNVTRIGRSAFSGCAGPTSITIPNSVTSIENSAFVGCYRLIEVINHSSLNIAAGDYSSNYGSIGYYAKHIITDAKDTYLATDDNGYIFYDDEKNVYLVGYTGPDTELVLPEVSPNGKKYEIYSGAFYGRTELTYITISNSVTYIGYCAFYGCTGLIRITISNSVTSIDDAAFSGCSGLVGIAIPNNVTSIGKGAFYGCTGLMSITVDGKNPVYRASGNCLIHMVTKTLILGCKNSVLPSDGSVTSIDRKAFCNCTELTSITIPNSVTSIGDSAFEGCTGLTIITIPDSVTSIGDSAFEGCTGLTSVKIPNSVTYIGTWAFENCGTFEILFDGTQEEWGRIRKGSDWMKNSSYTVTYLK